VPGLSGHAVSSKPMVFLLTLSVKGDFFATHVLRRLRSCFAFRAPVLVSPLLLCHSSAGGSRSGSISYDLFPVLVFPFFSRRGFSLDVPFCGGRQRFPPPFPVCRIYPSNVHRASSSSLFLLRDFWPIFLFFSFLLRRGSPFRNRPFRTRKVQSFPL